MQVGARVDVVRDAGGNDRQDVPRALGAIVEPGALAPSPTKDASGSRYVNGFHPLANATTLAFPIRSQGKDRKDASHGERPTAIRGKSIPANDRPAHRFAGSA